MKNEIRQIKNRFLSSHLFAQRLEIVKLGDPSSSNMLELLHHFEVKIKLNLHLYLV